MKKISPLGMALIEIATTFWNHLDDKWRKDFNERKKAIRFLLIHTELASQKKVQKS